MAEYQNIFTRVQVRAGNEPGVPVEDGFWPREKTIGHSWLLGTFGDAQYGPFYIGALGAAALATGFVSIFIMGMVMAQQVNWNPYEFVVRLPWLSLNPPLPEHGLKVLPPLNEGGWWLISGFFLTASIILWWLRTYLNALRLGMGTHVAWAFLSAIWLYLVLGFLRPIAMGSWSEAVPFGFLAHLEWTNYFSLALREPLLQPVPRTLDRLPLRFSSSVRDAWRDHSSGQPFMAETVRSSRSPTGARHLNARHCSGAGPWASTPRWNPSTAGLGGSRF